jgi:integrase
MGKNLPPRMFHKHGAFYYVTRVDGKLKWFRLEKDYQLALYKYAEMEGKITDQSTVSGLIQRYRSDVLPGKAPKTQADRKWQLNRLDKVFGKMSLEAVTPPHIQRYLDKREKKIAGNREIKLFSTLYRHAINWGLCNSNPCEGAFYHPEPGRDRYITDAELAKLKAAADPMMLAIIEFAYLVGSRRQDILKLERKDITINGVYIRQGKTNKRQLFSMTPELERVIKFAKRVNRKAKNLKYLFTNTRGQQITTTGFNSAWRRLRERTGQIDINFHDIRAKAITDAYQQRGLEYAQRLGGHENRDQTEHYIKKKDTEGVEPLC